MDKKSDHLFSEIKDEKLQLSQNGNESSSSSFVEFSSSPSLPSKSLPHRSSSIFPQPSSDHENINQSSTSQGSFPSSRNHDQGLHSRSEQQQQQINNNNKKENTSSSSTMMDHSQSRHLHPYSQSPYHHQQHQDLHHHDHHSQRALSPTLSMINDAISDLNKDIHVSKWRHIIRTVIIFFFLVIVAYTMTNVQVLVDNEALSYYYGVTTMPQWHEFNNSMHYIQDHEYLIKKFPNILIRKSFGGDGENGKMMNLTSSGPPHESYQALLLDDIIFRNYNWNFTKIKLLADVLCLLYTIVTIAFLFILPYFDAFKTTIRKKFKKSLKSFDPQRQQQYQHHQHHHHHHHRQPSTTSSRSTLNNHSLHSSNQGYQANYQNQHQPYHLHEPLHSQSLSMPPPNSQLIAAGQDDENIYHHPQHNSSNNNKKEESLLPSLSQLESQKIPYSQKYLKSIFLFPSRYIHSLVFVRRLLIIIAFNYLFRTLVVGVTIFPQESIACIPILRLSLGEKLYGAFLMILGIETACHDFIYSGHTAISTILAWFWIIYSSHALFHPHRYFIDLNFSSASSSSSSRFPYSATSASESGKGLGGDASFSSSSSTAHHHGEGGKGGSGLSRIIRKRKRSTTSTVIVWLIRFMAVVYLVIIAICLVISRIHYTVDVALGALVGSILFWLWHALVTLYYYFKFKSHILDYVDVAFHSYSLTTIPIEGEERRDDPSSPSDTRRIPSATNATTIGMKDLDPTEEKLRANREVRDILVPIKRTNMALNFVGWVDGYDLYVKDNIGFCSPDSHILPSSAIDSPIESHSDLEDTISLIENPVPPHET